MEHGDFSEERKAFAEACMVHGCREIDFLIPWVAAELEAAAFDVA